MRRSIPERLTPRHACCGSSAIDSAAVYVKPRGHLGRGYMTLIGPFRHRVVHPALLRSIERAWRAPAAPA